MNTVLRNVLKTVLFKNKVCFSTETAQVYRSAISTQNLYPNSNPKLTTPDPVRKTPSSINV